MNHSIQSADRNTHFKIIGVAFAAGFILAGFGISARANPEYAQSSHVIKAGKPVMITSADATLIR